MQPSELIELANKICRQKAESQTIELKAAKADYPKRLYDTLSSFSNQDDGGIIVFGIDEKAGFKVAGVYDPQNLQKQVTEQCNQMQPPVRALFTLAEIDGKTICSAEIPSIDISERPCYYKGAGKAKGAYVRVGDADLVMTEYEIYSYEAFRRHLHDDERPVERASMESLDMEEVSSYVRKRSRERPGFAVLSEHQKYELLNIMRGDRATLAAVMNFGLYPQGYFPELCITGIVVPGTEIGDVDGNNARFLDNRRIEGTISSMIEEALNFCMRNMKIITRIDPKDGKRTDIPEYPLEALREAILNAVIHRDYSIHTEGTPVQINFFTDRVEIHNPGGLYGRMSVEQLGYARPDLRNPALALMAETITSAENRYSGIPTMRRLMKEAGLSMPVFENRRNEFVVTFYNSKNEEDPVQISRFNAKAEKSILDFCTVPRSRKEIADYLGIQTIFYAMTHYVKPLLEAGKLGMTMPEKPQSSKQRFYTIEE